MPTFSVTPDAPTPALVPEKATPLKKTSNRRKKVVEPDNVPDTDTETPAVIEPATEHATEPDSPISEPTFPNMVILKQTEHNYIVKHNHYPVVGSSLSGQASSNDDISTEQSFIQNDLVSPNQIHKGQINKKRGRKPKAGLILNSKGGIYDTSEVPNIILHLKCHISDLKTNESISNYEYTPAISEVESYIAQSNYLQPSDISTQKNNDTLHEYESDTLDADDDPRMIMIENNVADDESTGINGNGNCNGSCRGNNPVVETVSGSVHSISTANTKNPSSKKTNAGTDAAIQVINERNQKEIMKKIHRLKYSFHNGESIQTKMNHRPACFWDTCEFDGPIYYIPIMIVNGVFQVTGCYCSPQCAVASLLKEPLDTSTKFERLHLLHLLYGVPNSKGFKPAPNPHYLLDKYYGNLTIQEYRSLLKGPQMIHIVNKPLTHILPELYEDNNDFLVNSKVIPANSLKMKKKYKTMVVQSGAE
jgi:hypothetical protein